MFPASSNIKNIKRYLFVPSMAVTSSRPPAKTMQSDSSRAWGTLTPSLAEWMLDAVSSMGFKRMTPVQASTIPLFMAYKDVIVEAVTGSGKTLAFLIPIVERLLRLEAPIKKNHIGAIVIAPTRELAFQIYGVLKSLLAFHSPSARVMRSTDAAFEDSEPQPPLLSSELTVLPQLLLGGNITPAQDLSHFLKHSPNLLISTPGRLLELLSSNHVHCPQSSFEVLVLDEADRLLDLGFKEDLQKILGKLPKQRRTGLFSASISEAVEEIVRVGLRNPVKIAVKVKSTNGGEDRRTPQSLQMCYHVAPATHKLPAISKILSTLNPTPSKSIIYFSTCAAVDYFQHIIPCILSSQKDQAFALIPLHGKHPPKVRQKNFKAFAESSIPTILLTTDVAARGLDIPQVDLVLQVDPPADPKVFLHRCGRAGRAGRRGLSIIFLHPGREEDYIGFLEVRKTPVDPLDMPSIDVNADEAHAATEAMRKSVLLDRALHDKAQRGFVSWAKSYSKHQANSIFRLEEIDWADLGNAWALLKLPKMPELKRWEGDRTLGMVVDFDSYGYKDKQREISRRQTAHEQVEAGVDNANSKAKPNVNKEQRKAWSQQHDQHDEREKRREKKQLRRKRQKWEQMTGAEREKQQELEKMIEMVKQKRIEDERYEEFEGFDD